VQEAGVDEPDIVKTDGRRLVTMAGGKLRIVDVGGDRPVEKATLPIAGESQQAQLLLSGGRVLVLHNAEPLTMQDKPGFGGPGGTESGVPYYRPEPARTQVTVVDIADMGAPKVVAEVKLDGSLVASRMVDGVARLVLRSAGPRLGFPTPTQMQSQEDVDRATAVNREVVAASTVEDWLPTYTYSEPGRATAAASGPLSDCRDVARPKDFSGLDMVSVLSVDADDPRPGPAATVLGAGELVYASAQNLYVTTSRWNSPDPVPLQEGRLQSSPRVIPGAAETEVHKFAITDKVQTRYLASGRVPGRLLNQFSMSELDGNLRVATTADGFGGGAIEGDRSGVSASESSVTVLRQDGQSLATIGSVGGLGRGERIYAVRFLGDRGYVVTFRQTDPLYVVDLSDPEHPAVKGELKIPGYSAYLHPVGEHRLLGVGQEATDQGRTVGIQMSLFDVSDPAAPKRLAHTLVPGAHSEAEFDHHAFLYWPQTGLTLLPVESYGDVGIMKEDVRGGAMAPDLRQSFVGAVGFAVSDGDINEVGRLRHRDNASIRRSLVVGDQVLTLSESGVLASDLKSLGERSWLSF